MPAVSLSERKRSAIQRELTATALKLFLTSGYEETTVDTIAAEAGMSRRTFFRYFASKEDLVVGKWDLIGSDVVERLSERPRTENDWEALRRAFDVVVDHYADPERRAQSVALDAVVASSAALSAAYLARIDAIEQRAAEILRTRGRRKAGDPVPLALAGAASACLHSAMKATLGTQPERLEKTLDSVMSALTPSSAL